MVGPRTGVGEGAGTGLRAGAEMGPWARELAGEWAGLRARGGGLLMLGRVARRGTASRFRRHIDRYRYVSILT